MYLEPNELSIKHLRWVRRFVSFFGITPLPSHRGHCGCLRSYHTYFFFHSKIFSKCPSQLSNQTLNYLLDLPPSSTLLTGPKTLNIDFLNTPVMTPPLIPSSLSNQKYIFSDTFPPLDLK